jgi:hypothetical protein
MLRPILAVALWLTSACAARTGAVTHFAERYGLSLLEAEAIVGEFDQAQTRIALRAESGEATSVGDAAVILESDDASRFAGAIRHLAGLESITARALAAQIELAWGESQLMTAELLERAAAVIRAKERTLESFVARGRASDAERVTLTSTHTTLDRLERVVHALQRLAQEHFQTGKELTLAVIAEAPNDPRGYRAAADYFHIVGDWASFDAMIAKIDIAAPHNARVLFLRGMEALDRDAAPGEALRLFRKAVDEDPGFARAQAQVVMLQRSLSDVRRELEKLERINPGHQLAVLAGPWLVSAEADAIAMRTRVANARRRSVVATDDDPYVPF